MMGARRALGPLAVALAWALSASAATAAGPLALVGGGGARSIALEPCRVAVAESAADPYGFGGGHLCKGDRGARAVRGWVTLSLLNSTCARVRLRVTYVSDRGRRLALSRSSAPVRLVGVGRHGLRIAGYGLGVLRLRFAVSPGEPASDLDGFVHIRASGRQRQTISVPVRVTAPDAGSLQVEPASLTLSIATSTRSKQMRVVVTGPGLPALLALQGTGPRTLRLAGQSGHLATLTLQPFALDAADPYRATSTLSYGDADRGSYHGSVALFSATPASPRLTVDLDVGIPLSVALLLVVVGAIVGLIVVVVATGRLRAPGDLLACVAAAIVAGTLMWLVVHNAAWGAFPDLVAAVVLGAAAALVLVAGVRALGPEPEPS
jgi:hypothetical protein